jgi:hypothetical protein
MSLPPRLQVVFEGLLADQHPRQHQHPLLQRSQPRAEPPPDLVHALERDDLLALVAELSAFGRARAAEAVVLKEELRSSHAFVDRILPRVIEACPDVLQCN